MQSNAESCDFDFFVKNSIGIIYPIDIKYAYHDQRSQQIVCFIQYKRVGKYTESGGWKIIFADSLMDESGNLFFSKEASKHHLMSAITKIFPDKSFLPEIFKDDMYLRTDEGIIPTSVIGVKLKYGGTIFVNCCYNKKSDQITRFVSLDLICDKDGSPFNKMRIDEIRSALLPRYLSLFSY